MATAKQRASARTNGHFGGAPTKQMIEVRRKAREKATRIVSANQEEAAKFLVYVMNNPNAPLPERVRCALELLNRGEMPAKSATYVGVGTNEELDKMFGTPKMFVFGKYETERADASSSAVVVTSEGDGGPAQPEPEGE